MEQTQQQNYWVIWYPSYTHKDFQLIDNKPIIEDITDNYFSDVHTYLKIETYHSGNDQDKESIRLSFYDIAHQKSIFFKIAFLLFRIGLIKERPITKLKPIEDTLLTENSLVARINLLYKKHSSNGLFVYTCNMDLDACLSENVSNLLIDKDQFPTFYLIKQLYHTHLFHRKSNGYKDYYFRAYLTSGSEPNITEPNNKFIKFFLDKILEYYEFQLKHFEEIKTNSNADFIKRKRQIENSIDSLEYLKSSINNNSDDKSLYLKKIYEEEIKKQKKYKVNTINLSKNRKDKRNLFITSNEIIGETIFTNTLCHSKYLDKKNDDIRKLLLNITNVNAGLIYVRDSYRYWYEKQVSTKSTLITNFWGILGWVVGLLGIAYSFYTQDHPNKSNQINSSEIRTELKGIDNHLINLHQDLIHKMSDKTK